MYSFISKIINYLSIVLTLLITIWSTRARAQCGQEELALCAKSLHILQSTSDLSIATKKEDLEKICPDLYSGLSCIRSYTRRCMTLKQRDHFHKLYNGTSHFIKDLCKEGPYQEEFLKHAPCLQTVKSKYEVCAQSYQETMSIISQKDSDENQENDIKTVCCSFRQYLDCSESIARKRCGVETATFTRGFLDRMSSSLIKMYCVNYTVNNGKCPRTEFSYSSASKTMISKLVPIVSLLSLIMLSFR